MAARPFAQIKTVAWKVKQLPTAAKIKRTEKTVDRSRPPSGSEVSRIQSHFGVKTVHGAMIYALISLFGRMGQA